MARLLRLLLLSNGNLLDPASIRIIKKVKGKMVIIRDESNQLLDLVKETSDIRQSVIVRVIDAVLKQGAEWVQPDWEAEFAKAENAVREAKETKEVKEPSVKKIA